MAESLVDGEFWLPPQFLADDGVCSDKKGSKCQKVVLPDSFGCFSVSSENSSLVESSFGSTETESDEDDFLDELTRQIANSTLNEELRNSNDKGGFVCGSPQSTLSAVGSGCSQGSSRGSPNGPSRVSSPPATWDLLHAAAGEVARMNLKENDYGFNNFGPATKPFAPANHLQSLYYRQPPATQQWTSQRSSGVWNGQIKRNQARNLRPMGLSPSAWPPLQQNQQHPPPPPPPQHQNGSDMRAVFLATSGYKRECAGTGVFLPRQIATQSVNRKKSGCSSVLLPAKVVRSLNLNFNQIRPKKPQITQTKYRSNEQATMRAPSTNSLHQQKRYQHPATVTNEIRLPMEWTY